MLFQVHSYNKYQVVKEAKAVLAHLVTSLRPQKIQSTRSLDNVQVRAGHNRERKPHNHPVLIETSHWDERLEAVWGEKMRVL
jgi:hypothetical protein